MKLFYLVSMSSIFGQAAVSPDPFDPAAWTELMKQVPALVVMGFIVRMFLQHIDKIDARKDEAVEAVLKVVTQSLERNRRDGFDE